MFILSDGYLVLLIELNFKLFHYRFHELTVDIGLRNPLSLFCVSKYIILNHYEIMFIMFDEEVNSIKQIINLALDVLHDNECDVIYVRRDKSKLQVLYDSCSIDGSKSSTKC